MKRWWILIPLAACLTWTAVNAEREGKAANPLEVEAAAAVMLDYDTGEWLYAHQADEPLPPASMSKMMTEILVLDDLASGRLNWNDPVKISDYAAAVEGAGMGLQAGETVAVRVLFEAMAIHSANDAAVALAEKSAGTEENFVKRMNRKAKALGLSGATRFANATGLSSGDLAGFQTAAAEGETVMTAKDVARMAKHLIDIHPEVLKTTRKSETGGMDGRPVLKTTNEMLPGQRFGTAGHDGLKTGYTQRAGYCFTGTTRRDGRRLITVVMGTETPEKRFEETRRLLEYGWNRGMSH